MRLYFILFTLLFFMMLVSCTNNSKNKSVEVESMPQDNIAGSEEFKSERKSRYSLGLEAMEPYLDRTHSVDELLTTSYPLSELMDYFFCGEPPEKVWDYPSLSISSELRFEDGLAIDNSQYARVEEINIRFPLECTRIIAEGEEYGEFYTVYKVAEGGRFYLFWTMFDEKVGMVACSGIYIPRLLKYKIFDSIVPGKSTFGDVVSIDPSTELVCFPGSGLHSGTRLQDGTYLVLRYDRQQSVETIEDYIVIEKSHSINPGGWFIGIILEEDLP